jgi:hypothetical protein
LRSPRVGHDCDQIAVLLEVDEQPHRLAVTTAARELRCIERVEAPVAREDQTLRRGFGRKRKLERVVGLERNA